MKGEGVAVRERRVAEAKELRGGTGRKKGRTGFEEGQVHPVFSPLLQTPGRGCNKNMPRKTPNPKFSTFLTFS